MRWFQLDVDMPADPKIRAVSRQLGVAGIGGLTCLWCHVGRHGSIPGRAIDSKGEPLALDELREASQLPPDQFEQLVAICLKTGHFARMPWEQSRGIWIPAMERRADTYARRQAAKKQLPLPHFGE